MEKALQSGTNYVIAIYIRLSTEDGDLSNEKMRVTVLATSENSSINTSSSTPNFQGRRFWNFVMMAILERTWNAPQSNAYCVKSENGKSTVLLSRICPDLAVIIS